MDHPSRQPMHQMEMAHCNAEKRRADDHPPARHIPLSLSHCRCRLTHDCTDVVRCRPLPPCFSSRVGLEPQTSAGRTGWLFRNRRSITAARPLTRWTMAGGKAKSRCRAASHRRSWPENMRPHRSLATALTPSWPVSPITAGPRWWRG